MGTFSDADREGEGAVQRQKATTAARGRRGAQGSERAPGLRGGLWRPGLHRRFVPLLIALTLASSLGVAGLAYFGERESAIATARTYATQDTRVLRQLLADQGAGIASDNGQLVVGQDNARLVLNGDTNVVDRAHDAMGAYAAIYQLQGPNLVSVSSNVPTTDAQGNPLPGRRLLGDTIGGPAYAALVGNCGGADTQSCHETYSGIVTLRGVSYVAAYAPLSDNGGAFVGVLVAAIPLERVLAPVTQQAVLLALIGLLLGMVALVAGYWVFEGSARQYFAALDAQLDAVGARAAQVSAVARSQAARAAQQEHSAQQTGEQSRTLDALARAMEQGYAGLHETAGELWAEMSQPGTATAPDPIRASAQARQAAVIAARVGTAAAQAHDLCRHIALSMRQVIAEGRAIMDGGRELDLRASRLLGMVEQAGTTAAEHLSPPAEQARDEHATRAVRAATRQHPAAGASSTAAHTGIPRTLASRPRQTGSMPSTRPSSGRNLGGARPPDRPGMPHATGGFPSVPQSPPPPQPGTQPTGQMRRFPMRPPDAPNRFPDQPPGVDNPPSQFLPNPHTQVFDARADTFGQRFAAWRTGEWPAPAPGSQPPPAPPTAPDASGRDDAPRSNERPHRFGLPDLSEQGHVPDWRDGEPE